jgi:hypothetical protein
MGRAKAVDDTDRHSTPVRGPGPYAVVERTAKRPRPSIRNVCAPVRPSVPLFLLLQLFGLDGDADHGVGTDGFVSSSPPTAGNIDARSPRRRGRSEPLGAPPDLQQSLDRCRARQKIRGRPLDRNAKVRVSASHTFSKLTLEALHSLPEVGDDIASRRA